MRRDETKENKVILVDCMNVDAITSHEVTKPQRGRRDMTKPEKKIKNRFLFSPLATICDRVLTSQCPSVRSPSIRRLYLSCGYTFCRGASLNSRLHGQSSLKLNTLHVGLNSKLYN